MKRIITSLGSLAIMFSVLVFAAACDSAHKTGESSPGIVSEGSIDGAYTIIVRALPVSGATGLQAKGTAREAALLHAQARAKERYPHIDIMKHGEELSASFDGTTATVIYRVTDPSIKAAGAQ